MIRIYKSKFSSLFALLILLIHTTLAPLSVFASNSESVEPINDPIKIGEISLDDKEEIPLFKEVEHGTNHTSDDYDSSNILIYLNNKDKVDVMKELEKYSLVIFSEVIDKADPTDTEPKVWQGYIENQYLQVEQEDSSEKNSDQKDKSTEGDTTKPETDLDEESVDGNDDPETDLDEESVDGNDDPETNLDEENVDGNNDPETDLDEENVDGNDDPETDLDEENVDGNDDPETDLDEENMDGNDDPETDLDEENVDGNDDPETDLDEENVDKYNDETKENVIASKFRAATFSVKSYRGIAKKARTNIRTKPSTKVDILKSVPIGTILNYKTHNEYWYKTSIDGKTGYIHKKHVENAVNNQETIKGVALKSPTNVRAIASTKAKVAHTFQIGSIIEYKTFSNYWYEVFENNKSIGFVHKKHVENSTAKPESIRGIASKSPTNIRTLPSTKSKVVATYSQGSVINYKAFNKYWYEVAMVISGEVKHGFVHKKHVENAISKQKTINGVTLKSPTNVRNSASTKSSVAKTYPIGTNIEYKTFSEYWYEVFENSKSIGFVHKKHVYESTVTKQESLRGVAKRSPTNIRNAPSTSVKVAKQLKIGTVFEYKTFSKYWYEVFESGKSIGFVHKNHVENSTVKEKSSEGIGLRSPTNIRTLPSTKSNVLTTYSKGALIKYKTFNKYWNVVTVKVNGETRTGFIHKKHIGEPSSTNTGSTNYNLTLNKALDIQMKATPQTDKKYAWVSKSYIDGSNKVTASSLNVRVGPGTSYKSVGTISKNTEVNVLDEHNGWYAIQHNPGGQWRHARPADVRYYLDPANFINDSIQKFQFLNLAKTSGASKGVLNNYLKGRGILQGQAKAFIEAGQKHGINDIYLISHAILETGHGKSTLANGVKYKGVTVYNMYGIGAYDSCPIDCGAKYAYEQGWTSPAKAIIGGAEFIGNGYIKEGQNTLYKMRWDPVAMESNGRFGKQYATDIGWASKQVYTIYNLYKEIGSYTLHLDVPVYKK